MELESVSKVIEAIISGITSDEDIAKKKGIDIEEVKRIKEELQKTHALEERLVVNPLHDKINKKIVVYHLYKCRGGPDKIKFAAKKIAKLPFIEEIHAVIGQFDLMVKFRVSSLEEYHRILNRDIWTIIEIAGIVNSMGIVSLHTYLDRAGYEIKEFTEELK